MAHEFQQCAGKCNGGLVKIEEDRFKARYFFVGKELHREKNL